MTDPGPSTLTEPSTLAVVTGELAPDLSDDGQRLAAALETRGIHAEPVMWTDTSVDWADFDGVLLRSCWEYPEDVGRFRSMLDEIDRAGVPVCNPLEVVRWNLHKSYLRNLADEGVTIPPTAVVEQGSGVDLEALLAERDWSEAVVKPAVGARSAEVWRTRRDEARGADRFASQVAGGDVLVQEFLPEISTGERSIVFFEGVASHAWNSRPTGDPTAFGETEIDAGYGPDPDIREQARGVLEAAGRVLELDADALPYARVDYVPREGDLVLMELELVEPFLGLERGEGAVERFCDAVVSVFE